MHRFGQPRHTLYSRRAGSDDPDALVGQPAQVGSGVLVVPAAGMKGMPAEICDAGYSRQFWFLQIAICHCYEPGANLVAPVGGDHPPGTARLPTYFLHLGLQTGVTVQVVVLGDAAAVGQDLITLGVLLGRDIAELFEQRHIDVGLNITGDSGVAIPVPGSTDVGSLVDQPHIVDAELPAPRPDE